MEPKTFSLCEAVADIAYIAGSESYYSGDSRKDISDFISWANEFESIHAGVEWGVNSDTDYIDAITDFTLNKIRQ